jgi:hypothetical protein
MLQPMRPGRRTVGGLRHLLPVAVCALGGHAVLYRSLLPRGGAHAYLAWYEPAVAGLSMAALAVIGLMLLAVVLGRAELRDRLVRVLLPATAAPQNVSVRAARLTLASVVFLAVQETLERSLSEDRLAPSAFSSSEVLLVLATLSALALLVALLERSCSELIALVVSPPRLRARASSPGFPRVRPQAIRRRNPLAELRGLRAPPALG